MPISRQEKLAIEVAEVLAIQALGYIGGNGERLGRFLAVTGIGPDKIRSAARERHFLVGVLDYLRGDEELLVAFASDAGVDPATIQVARHALAGAVKEDRDD